MVEIRCVIQGKVQGVRYRDYVQGAATELGVCGFVRNQSDGTVLVCAQGVPDTLRLFIEYLHEGSLQSRVDAVSVDWVHGSLPYDDFSIHHV